MQEQEEPEESLVLVGFGKHPLKTVMRWIGTEKEAEVVMAPTLWPPWYRPLRNCTEEDISLFKQYTLYVCSILDEAKG